MSGVKIDMTDLESDLGSRFFDGEVDGELVKTGLIAREPAMAHAAAAWLVAQWSGLLMGHTHLFTHQQWSGLSTALYGLVSAVILGGMGKALRERVTPASAGLGVAVSLPDTSHIDSVLTDTIDPLGAPLAPDLGAQPDTLGTSAAGP